MAFKLYLDFVDMVRVVCLDACVVFPSVWVNIINAYSTANVLVLSAVSSSPLYVVSVRVCACVRVWCVSVGSDAPQLHPACGAGAAEVLLLLGGMDQEALRE